jgi:hypothetical protein
VCQQSFNPTRPETSPETDQGADSDARIHQVSKNETRNAERLVGLVQKEWLKVGEKPPASDAKQKAS